MTSPGAPSQTSRAWAALWITLIVLGAALLAYRGPYRALQPAANQDFCLVYAQARAWLHGFNPYREESVREAFATAGAPPERDPMGGRRSSVLVYPPHSYPLWAPLAALPWPVASVAWVGINTALYVLGAVFIARMLGLLGNARLAFWACAVWSAPAQTVIAHGQTSTPVLAGVALAALLQARRNAKADQADPPRRDLGSPACGVLLALAVAIKPQLGLLFLLYQVGRMRWRTVAWAVATMALVFAVGFGRMALVQLDGWSLWTGNIQAFTTTDDADPTRRNPVAYQVLNLHYPLHRFFEDRDTVRLLVYAILGALSLAYFLVDLRRGRDLGERRDGWHAEILSLAMVAVITLSITYHRHYNATIMLFAAGVVMLLWSSRQALLPRILLTLVVASFAVPYSVVMTEAANRGWIPRAIGASKIVDVLVVPLQSLSLPVAAGLLVALRRRALGRAA